MRIARIVHHGRPSYAVVDGDVLTLVEDPFSTGRTSPSRGPRLALDAVRLLAPVEPRTVVGMAHNTGAADRELPPQAFLKPARSVIGPGETVGVPPGVGRVDAEGELAVVLGSTARDLTADDALDAVLGYTVANDVTARALQQTDPLWTSAKGYDGFTPLGPWIDTDVDPDGALVQVTISGRRLAAAPTSDLARNVVEILVHVTSFLTLGPGDVVLTGAPGEYAEIVPGDDVSVTVEGLGTLSNPVVARTGAPRARDRRVGARA
jgi:2-keto-4-pentenoate hydratase/2-oxohepta-3-ene-1,7-dioic acid hydratase in catechol pathway